MIRCLVTAFIKAHVLQSVCLTCEKESIITQSKLKAACLNRPASKTSSITIILHVTLAKTTCFNNDCHVFSNKYRLAKYVKAGVFLKNIYFNEK